MTGARGAGRMAISGVLFIAAICGLSQPTALTVLVLLLSVPVFMWGAQRAFVGPSLPRIGARLERMGREWRE